MTNEWDEGKVCCPTNDVQGETGGKASIVRRVTVTLTGMYSPHRGTHRPALRRRICGPHHLTSPSVDHLNLTSPHKCYILYKRREETSSQWWRTPRRRGSSPGWLRWLTRRWSWRGSWTGCRASSRCRPGPGRECWPPDTTQYMARSKTKPNPTKHEWTRFKMFYFCLFVKVRTKLTKTKLTELNLIKTNLTTPSQRPNRAKLYLARQKEI